MMSKSISTKHSSAYSIGYATQEEIDSSQLCQKSIVLDNHTKENKESHSKSKTRECELCEKIFTHTYDLQRHMRIHTGEKAYLCLLCKKTFAYSSSLKTHTRTHTG